MNRILKKLRVPPPLFLMPLVYTDTGAVNLDKIFIEKSVTYFEIFVKKGAGQYSECGKRDLNLRMQIILYCFTESLYSNKQ